MIGNCNACLGKGEIKDKICEKCNGSGKLVYCELCGKEVGALPQIIPICQKCEKEKNVVYQLDDIITIEDLIAGKRYLGVVKEIQSFGYFVSLNENIKGLLHNRNVRRKLKLNEEVIVLVSNVVGKRIELRHVELQKYTLFPLKKYIKRSRISEIDEESIGNMVKIQGMITQARQTSGPTIFTIIDETSSIEAIAYRMKNRRFFRVDDIVSLVGEVSTKLGSLRIEIKQMEKLYGKEYTEVKERIDKAIKEKSEPEEIDFLIESEILERLRPKMREIAKEIRRAIYLGVPIVIRHHADADGFVGGIALEQAILPLLREWSPDPEAEWHLFRRSPSKAPFYEMEDVVRDLHFAHEDVRRFGQKMPLLIIVDNGSTREDIPSLKKFKIYNSKILVIDHHYPGEVVNGRVEADEFIDLHVNPYLVGGDYSLTAGCLACEIARLINPGISEKIEHLPGIACIADRVNTNTEYIEIARRKGFPEEVLKKIAEAIDFEAFYLRFMDGKTLIEDLLALNRLDRHRKLLEHVYNQAMKMQENQLKACLPNTKTIEFKNGIVFNTIDLEKHAHKFTYPPPGKTCGIVHDSKVKENEGKPVVTLGYASDFAILRATDELSFEYNLNLNKIIEELQKEIPEAGVDGGGHEVAGSIKFVEGYRKQVLERFAEKIARLRRRNNVGKN